MPGLVDTRGGHCAGPGRGSRSPLRGGAIRANYIHGDYAKENSGAPQRGGNGGNFVLDTFRINLDLAKDGWIGKGEYRGYNGYNFLHTGGASGFVGGISIV